MIKLFLFSIVLLTLAGCSSHSLMRGTVAMKINEKQAHICLGSDSLKLGDDILFYSNSCRRLPKTVDEGGIDCTLRKLGQGKVSRIINSHYSQIDTDGSFKFSEGTLVEKIK